ncbi:MAG: hypothetical protein ACOC2H_00925 [Spirochaetota bacterium]
MRNVLLLLLTVFFLSACEGEPILTNLTTTDIKLVYKATYASNNPRPWWDGKNIDPSSLVDDSAVNSVPPEMPEFILSDIAEVRMNNEKFARNRSYKKVGLVDDHSLFDGTGVSIECNDLEDNKSYSQLEIFFRKLVYGNARMHTRNWKYKEEIKTQFGNDKLKGYDVIQRIKYSQSNHDEDDESNLIFPFKLKLRPAYKHQRNQNNIIEFRFVLKNYIKYYEYIDEDDDVYAGYFGPGDHIEDVQAGDKYIGGNMMGAVYVYDPDKTVTITGSAPAGTYVAAIDGDESIEDYVGTTLIPPRATWCADGTYVLENVMSGRSYLLYYSTNTPSTVDAEIVDGYTGEQLLEIDEAQAGETIILNF